MKFLKKLLKFFCYRHPLPQEDFSADPLPPSSRTSQRFPSLSSNSRQKQTQQLRQTTLLQYFTEHKSNSVQQSRSQHKITRFKSLAKAREKKPEDEPSKIQEKTSTLQEHHTPRSHHSFHKERRESFYNQSSANLSSTGFISNSSLVLQQPELFITRRSIYSSPREQENSPSPVRNETEACEVGASPLEELKLRTRIIPELRTKSSSFSSNQSPVRSLFFTNERPSFKYPNNFTFCENSKEEASHLKGQVKGFGSPGNESVKTGLLTSVSSLPEGKFSENPLYPSVSLRSKESSEKENGPYNHIIYK